VARIWFLLGYAALLLLCVAMMVWAATGGPQGSLGRDLFQVASDAFKTVLGATIGAMSAMIAAYIDYKREKAKLAFEISRLQAQLAHGTGAAPRDAMPASGPV